MKSSPDGNAIVYCEGMFNTLNGKTAHGLVRFTNRYRVLSVVDSRYAGRDAGKVLDGKTKKIPIFASLDQAVQMADSSNRPATHFIVGLAPDGGRLPSKARQDVSDAIAFGLNVDCGLHDYLSEDSELANLADRHNVQIRDIRKPAPINSLHFLPGKGKIDTSEFVED